MLKGEDVVVVKDLHMSSVIENMYLTMFVLSAWSMKSNNLISSTASVADNNMSPPHWLTIATCCLGG